MLGILRFVALFVATLAVLVCAIYLGLLVWDFEHPPLLPPPGASQS